MNCFHSSWCLVAAACRGMTAFPTISHSFSLRGLLEHSRAALEAHQHAACGLVVVNWPQRHILLHLGMGSAKWKYKNAPERSSVATVEARKYIFALQFAHA
uniref:Putative secreted protein n=1 Tax=Anopheles darlingi TaxID=43151 RepID=A0A2M4DHC7_ANODA